MKKKTAATFFSLIISLSCLNMTAGLNPVIKWDNADNNNSWIQPYVLDKNGNRISGSSPLALACSRDLSQVMIICADYSNSTLKGVTLQNGQWCSTTNENENEPAGAIYNWGDSTVEEDTPDHFSVASDDNLENAALILQTGEEHNYYPELYLYDAEDQSWIYLDNSNYTALSDIWMDDDSKIFMTPDGKYRVFTYRSFNTNPESNLCSFCQETNTGYTCANAIYDYDSAMTRSFIDPAQTQYGLLYAYNISNVWYAKLAIMTQGNISSSSSSSINANIICQNDENGNLGGYFRMAMDDSGSLAVFVYTKSGKVCYNTACIAASYGVIFMSNEKNINDSFNNNSLPYFNTSCRNSDWTNCNTSKMHITSDKNHLALLYIGQDYNLYLLKADINVLPNNNLLPPLSGELLIKETQYQISNISVADLGFSAINTLQKDTNNNPIGPMQLDNDSPIFFDARFYDYTDSNTGNYCTKVALLLTSQHVDNNGNELLMSNTGTITWTAPESTQTAGATPASQAANTSP